MQIATTQHSTYIISLFPSIAALGMWDGIKTTHSRQIWSQILEQTNQYGRWNKFSLLDCQGLKNRVYKSNSKSAWQIISSYLSGMKRNLLKPLLAIYVPRHQTCGLSQRKAHGFIKTKSTWNFNTYSSNPSYQHFLLHQTHWLSIRKAHQSIKLIKPCGIYLVAYWHLSHSYGSWQLRYVKIK